MGVGGGSVLSRVEEVSADSEALTSGSLEEMTETARI